MVIIRLILLALVPVYLADGLSDGSKDSKVEDYPLIPADITLAEVCNSYINGWYTKPPVPTRRIHKFINAEPGTFPFMGALGWRFKGSTKYGFRCAGTLINEKFILTAAHCAILELNLSKQFVSQKPEIVAFGIENIAEVNTVTEPRQPKVVNIKKMIQHPKYHSPMRYHDIALIESDVNIEFTDFVYPACLWAQDHNPDFEIKPVLVGWQFDGSSDIPIAKAERLKYGKVDLVDNHNCNKMIEMKNQSKRLFKDGIIDGQLCAQGAIEGDTCKDDSGGPLLYFGPIKRYFPTVVGVTSFGFMGKECGGLDLFGIYTRVSQYVDWIARVAFGDGLNEEYEDTASNPSDKEPNSGGPIVFKDEGYLQRISELKCEQYITKTILFNQDSRRIVKGHPAKEGQFPFMGAVGWEIGNDTANPYEFKCGSTLISEKFVLTTAHCTRLNLLLEKKSTRVIIRPRVVLLGVEDLDPTKVAPDRQGKLVEISKITHYPAYNFVSRYDDIAVMELAEEVVFTQYIYPACLWSRGDIDLVDKVATIAGWGVTNSALSKIENHLQYGEVTILHSSICNISLSDIINRKWMHGIDDKQICAVNAVEGTDTCQGDSGGPLVYYTLPEGYSVKKFPSVVGVTSFGLGCGYVPGVYMRVSSYIDWIEKMVWYN